MLPTAVDDPTDQFGELFETAEDTITSYVLPSCFTTIPIPIWETPSRSPCLRGANGTVSYDATTEDVTYTPDPDWSGTDSFTYTISDGQGGTDTATVEVTVTRSTMLPTAVDDPTDQFGQLFETEEDTITSYVLPSCFTTIRTLIWETPSRSPVSPVGPTVRFPDDATTEEVTYTPDPDWSGTDSFTYTISDGHGGDRHGDR